MTALARAARFHLSRPLRRCRATGLLLPKSLLVQVRVAADAGGGLFLRPKLLDLAKGGFDDSHAYNGGLQSSAVAAAGPPSTELAKQKPCVYVCANERILSEMWRRSSKKLGRNQRRLLRNIAEEYGLDQDEFLSLGRRSSYLKQQLLVTTRHRMKRDQLSPEMVAVLSAEEHPGFVEYIERMLLLDVHQWISQCSGGMPDLISADESLLGVEALIEQRSEHFGGPDAFYLDVSANANDGDINDLKSQSLHSRAWEGFTPEECVETCALLALQRFSLYHQQGDL